MKNICKPFGLSVLLVLLSLSLFARTYDKEGQIERMFKINKNTAIDFSNKSSDLTVKTWNKESVKLECFYKIKANSQDDLDKTLEALEEMGVEQSPNRLSIKTGIFTSVHSVILSGVIKKITATLTNGVAVDLKELKLEYVLTIPDNHDLNLKQKYSDLSIPDYNGKVTLDLYDVDMTAGNLPDLQTLKAKYSNLYFSDLSDCEFDIYDTDVEIEAMANLSLTSKYSKFRAEKVGDVKLDSYDDKIYFNELTSMDGKSKYTDFEIGDTKYLNLDLYDCNMRGGNSEKFELKAKYSDFTFDNIDIFSFYECYDNKVDVKTVGEFSSKSKYTAFTFNRVRGMIDLETYDDKLKVFSMDHDFYLLSIDGKYTKVEVSFDKEPKFYIDLDVKYTKRELPDYVVYRDFNSQRSNSKVSGRTEGLSRDAKINIKTDEAGVRKANIGKINIEQYDGSLIIK